MAIIYTYPTKAAPTADDLVLISDAADSNKTKNAKISSIQSLVSGVNSVNGLAGAVLLDAASSNLVRTTTPGTNTISYDLASSPTIAGTLTAAGLKPSGGANPTAITKFETGEWTPNLQYYDGSLYYDVVGGSAPITGLSYLNQGGYYTRVNNFVTLHIKLIVSKTAGTGVFNCQGLRVTGVPFAVNTTYGGSGALMIYTYSSVGTVGSSSNNIPYPTSTSFHLNYSTIKNPDPAYFGGTGTFNDTGNVPRTLPLASPPAGEGGQQYLTPIGTSIVNKSRIGEGTTQWWGTVTYYTTA